MLVSEIKDRTEILSMAAGKGPVFLVGCADCATLCRSGGEEQLKQWQEILVSSGIGVSGYAVPESPCVAANVKKMEADFQPQLEQSAVILVFSCGAGVQSVRRNIRFSAEVIAACDTLFAGSYDSKGRFAQECVSCGNCRLSSSAGICPVALCPKGMLNGPCGGVSKGKCELDREKDCVWVLIYEALVNKGKTDDFFAITPPRDYSLGCSAPFAAKAIDLPRPLH